MSANISPNEVPNEVPNQIQIKCQIMSATAKIKEKFKFSDGPLEIHHGGVLRSLWIVAKIDPTFRDIANTVSTKYQTVYMALDELNEDSIQDSEFLNNCLTILKDFCIRCKREDDIFDDNSYDEFKSTFEEVKKLIPEVLDAIDKYYAAAAKVLDATTKKLAAVAKVLGATAKEKLDAVVKELNAVVISKRWDSRFIDILDTIAKELNLAKELNATAKELNDIVVSKRWDLSRSIGKLRHIFFENVKTNIPTFDPLTFETAKITNIEVEEGSLEIIYERRKLNVLTGKELFLCSCDECGFYRSYWKDFFFAYQWIDEYFTKQYIEFYNGSSEQANQQMTQ